MTTIYDVDDFDEFEDTFHRHYEAEYATGGYNYERYIPAYRYGYDLATDSRYRDYDWEDVEPEAHRRWEEFKDAVRHG